MATTNKNIRFSFEFFPPKTSHAMASLWHCIEKFQQVQPDFFSVTYGAGGSTKLHTYDTVCTIQHITQIPVMAHLTCLGTEKQTVDRLLKDYWRRGIKHLLALRGDHAKHGAANQNPYTSEYSYPYQLIRAARQIGNFTISVAVYPEGHPEALNPQQELEILKQKIDEGATQAITQFFFDNHLFYDYLERVRAAHIDIPVIPGILPVTNFTRTLEFSEKCRVTIPAYLRDKFRYTQHFDEHSLRFLAADFAIKQCQDLIQQTGADRFHFYSLNRADLSLTICRMLELGQIL